MMADKSQLSQNRRELLSTSSIDMLWGMNESDKANQFIHDRNTIDARVMQSDVEISDCERRDRTASQRNLDAGRNRDGSCVSGSRRTDERESDEQREHRRSAIRDAACRDTGSCDILYRSAVRCDTDLGRDTDLTEDRGFRINAMRRHGETVVVQTDLAVYGEKERCAELVRRTVGRIEAGMQQILYWARVSRLN